MKVKPLKISLFLLFITLFPGQIIAQKQNRSLGSENWFFTYNRNSTVYPAQIPSFFHLDLYKQNLIPDPFYATNETQLQWIDSANFSYSTKFQIQASELNHDFIEMVFEGIDTYAKIYLNGNEILTTENMFVEYQVNVKNLLNMGENKLEIFFTPTSHINKLLSEKDSLIKPEKHRIYTRKAQYMFGWDWGTEMISGGIWKDIKLEFWNKNKINDLLINQLQISDTLAKLQFQIELQSKPKSDLRLIIQIIQPNGISITQLEIKTQDSIIKIEHQIQKPELWWTYDLGKPNLYQIKLSLLEKDKKLDSKELKIGLRSIELVQEADSIGANFFFRLNGQPIFAKGVNAIPFHHFSTEVKKSDYEFYTNRIIDANMNMIRIWGGGIYETDEFYEICDEKGILVWQDFMFAGALYPADSAFIEQVETEITQQIKRLRHHASLAIWCGNNEISEAWHNWGWQKQFSYTKADSIQLIGEYEKLFEKKIAEIIQKYDTQRYYHPSSPTTGWGRKRSYQMGDVHYWGVWWGMEPLENYQKKVGRFVSEYGFQSLPSITSLSRFIPKNELVINSPSLKSHQKHPIGFETIDNYLSRDFSTTNQLEEYAYLSQLLQARALKLAIESHRLAKPYCMGSLVWQLNDTWPVVSWSLIDFYQKPKASYYQVKKSFNSILPIISDLDSAITVNIVSDLPQNLHCKINYGLYNFTGDTLFIDSLDYDIPSFSNHKILKISKEDIEKSSKSTAKEFMMVEMFFGDSLIINQKHYFVKPKELKILEPQIEIEILDTSYLVIESKNQVAIGLFLEAEGVYFYDNFLELMPNKSLRIKYIKQNKQPLLEKQISWKTFTNP